LALKIAPDMEAEEIDWLANTLLANEIDAVIATNTTSGREGVEHLRVSTETGGLSGAPLYEKSTQVVVQLANILAGKIPIIAAGGIMTADQALAKQKAGASLVQLYTGLIYQGPQLVKDILEKWDYAS